ncbi:hypothetical protein FQZ97_843530 [compost metagenome]
MREQAVQAVAHGVVLQVVEVVERFEAPARQPVRARQDDEGAQHRIGNRGALQHLDARLEQAAGGLEFVPLVEHVALQARGHAGHADAGGAVSLRLLQYRAEQVLRFGHAAFEREAHAGEAARDQAAPGRGAVLLRGLFQQRAGLGVGIAVHVHPGQQVVAPREDGLRVVRNGFELRRDRQQGLGVVALKGQAAAQ